MQWVKSPIAVTFNHRSPDEHLSLSDVAGDVDDLVKYVRKHAEELQIDRNRLAIWAGSAGVPLGVRAALTGNPAFVKCLVTYYGPLELQPLMAAWELTEDAGVLQDSPEQPRRLARLLEPGESAEMRSLSKSRPYCS